MPQESPTPRLLLAYRRYLTSEDTAAFIAEVSEHYLIGTLERLVVAGGRLVRRAAILALGFLADYESNAIFGRALLDEDRAVRLIAEETIRSVWTRCGSSGQRRMVASLVRLNQAGDHVRVLQLASQLILEAPWIAEAWNQRGIAYFAIRDFEEAIADASQTLELNPYHFGAALGMGEAYLQLNDPYRALECFQRALKVHPGLERVRVQVRQLQRSLE